VSPDLTERELKAMIDAEVQKRLGARSPTENYVDHVCSCPDCYCGVIDKMNETSDYICADCGFPLGSEEFAKKLKDCPNCHSETAKMVER
jgi:hypothetical protein